MSVAYKTDNVLVAAQKRVRYLFDRFEEIVVSVSGGKDSTCLYDLVLTEAIRRDRQVRVFFLDQEAEYASTIEIIEGMMRHPNVIPEWYQVPLQMTNATSSQEVFLNAWFEGEEWMRPKHELAIHRIDDDYPQRFYKFFAWHEKQQQKPTAF